MPRQRLALLIVLPLLPALVLAPVWRRGGLGAGEDDVLYYFPSRVFFHDSLRAGFVPWWNPWTGCGRPFAADPQSALWYPTTWLFALLPPVAAYGASLWLHYGLALWGTYRLLRWQHLARSAAAFGAITFAFSGFLLAHRAHFTIQHAAAWTPIVLWLGLRWVARSRSQDLAAFALAGALQILAGHVQVAALTALGGLILALAWGTPRRKASIGPPAALTPSGSEPAIGRPPSARDVHPAPAPSGRADPDAPGLRCAVIRGCRWSLAWLLPGCLSAIQLLPTWLYMRECNRLEMPLWHFLYNSWHPSSAITLVLPMIFGQRTPNFFGQPWWGHDHQSEQFAYVGILPLVLALVALRRGWWEVGRRPWVLLAGLACLLALGKFGPIAPALYFLPGASVFRVPARAVLLLDLALAVLAAHTVNELAGPLTPLAVRCRARLLTLTRRPIVIAAAAVAAGSAVALLTSLGMEPAGRQAALDALRPANPALWAPALVVGLGLAALGRILRHFHRPGCVWLLVPLIVADLGLIGWTLDVPPHQRTAAEILDTARCRTWADPIRASGQRLWVVTDTAGIYSDPLSRSVANTNILLRIPTLTDYGPLQPRSVVSLFGLAFWGVTDRAADLLRHSQWMSAFNVGWVLLDGPDWPPPTGGQLVATFTAPADGPPPQLAHSRHSTARARPLRLYRIPTALGPAFIQLDAGCLPADLHSARPHELITVVKGPGTAGGHRTAPHPALTSNSSFHPPASAPDAADARTVDGARSPVGVEPGAAANPARLVVCQLALRGWRAWCAGRELPIEPAYGALLSVRIPRDAEVRVEWRYRPPGLAAGACITLISACAVVGLARVHRRPAAGK